MRISLHVNRLGSNKCDGRPIYVTSWNFDKTGSRLVAETTDVDVQCRSVVGDVPYRSRVNSIFFIDPTPFNRRMLEHRLMSQFFQSFRDYELRSTVKWFALAAAIGVVSGVGAIAFQFLGQVVDILRHRLAR